MHINKIQNVYNNSTTHSTQANMSSFFNESSRFVNLFFRKMIALGVLSISLSALAEDSASKNIEKVHAELAAGSKKVHVIFTQKDSKTVIAAIQGEGFSDSVVHGLHIHEFGKCEGPEFKSAGGHFNPTSMPHGAPSMKTHSGDLGNVTGDKKGHYKHEITLHDASINGANSILGKSVVLHAKADDFKSQPSGDSGPRIGCSVIEPKK